MSTCGSHLRRVYQEIKDKELAVPHKTQLSRARIKLDMMLMNLRQSEFAGEEWFIYLSADASPQGSLEFYVVLEDKIRRSDAALIMEATPEERARWCSAVHLRTSPLPICILGSGKASAASKFEALIHASILDGMHDGDPAHMTKYATSIISYCSDYGTEAALTNIPSVSVQHILNNNVLHSQGLLTMKSAVSTRYLLPIEDDAGAIVEDVVALEPPAPSTSSSSNVVVPEGSGTGGDSASDETCSFGMSSSLMIPGVKHMFDNVHKELLAVLQHFPTFSEANHKKATCIFVFTVAVPFFLCFTFEYQRPNPESRNPRNFDIL